MATLLEDVIPSIELPIGRLDRGVREQRVRPLNDPQGMDEETHLEPVLCLAGGTQGVEDGRAFRRTGRWRNRLRRGGRDHCEQPSYGDSRSEPRARSAM